MPIPKQMNDVFSPSAINMITILVSWLTRLLSRNVTANKKCFSKYFTLSHPLSAHTHFRSWSTHKHITINKTKKNDFITKCSFIFIEIYLKMATNGYAPYESTHKRRTANEKWGSQNKNEWKTRHKLKLKPQYTFYSSVCVWIRVKKFFDIFINENKSYIKSCWNPLVSLPI